VWWEAILNAIDRQRWLDRPGKVLRGAVGSALARGGLAGRWLKNALHGTWLGHPLHPVLTDVPLGAWSAVAVLDALDAFSGRHRLRSGADAILGVGLAAAVGAAASGLNDWQHTHGRPSRIGLVHGSLNLSATLLYATSLWCRRNGARGAGQALGFVGYALAFAAAYLGGHLVYGERIGVDHATREGFPRDFVPVLPETELEEGKPRRATAGEAPIVLVRCGGQIYALGETCSHLGGPLSQGTLSDCSITCPWHGSRFSLEDGRVLDGPATYPAPRLEVRVHNGQIEVRAARA